MIARVMTITIDPEILAARDAQAMAVPAFDVTKLPIDEGRRLANAASMIFADGKPDLARIEDISIAGPGGPLQLRLYEPAAPRARGAVLYMHGGGWFACNLDTHDRMMRLIAQHSGALVVGVDFRLAPEHPFPAALEDVIAAWEWLVANAASLGIDPARLAVAGDSAGANLALALSIDRRDRALPAPCGGALLYGCFAPDLETESARTFGEGGYGLTHERMQWYWRNYLGAQKDAPPALATPLHADLRGLPPFFLGIADADSVADDSRLLLERLQAAGVKASLSVWANTVHGFLQMTRDVASARAAVRETGEALCAWVA